MGVVHITANVIGKFRLNEQSCKNRTKELKMGPKIFLFMSLLFIYGCSSLCEITKVKIYQKNDFLNVAAIPIDTATISIYFSGPCQKNIDTVAIYKMDSIAKSKNLEVLDHSIYWSKAHPRNTYKFYFKHK